MAGLFAKALLATPSYSFAEAAHYLNVPVRTLRAWCLGRSYTKIGKRGRVPPLIKLDAGARRALSFQNLIEAHVLEAIWRQHYVSLPAVRRALEYVAKELKADRPLAQMQFQTDGVDLFVEKLGALGNVTRLDQMEMADLIMGYLKRIERGAKGAPVRLYLLTRSSGLGDQIAPVVVDPRVAFGRPVLAGRAVPTAVLADRFKAGDKLEELAQDFDTTREVIEEALRYEFSRKAA